MGAAIVGGMLLKTLRESASSVGAAANDTRRLVDQVADIVESAPTAQVQRVLNYVEAVAEQVDAAAKAHRRAADTATEFLGALAVLCGIVATAVLAREALKLWR